MLEISRLTSEEWNINTRFKCKEFRAPNTCPVRYTRCFVLKFSVTKMNNWLLWLYFQFCFLFCGCFSVSLKCFPNESVINSKALNFKWYCDDVPQQLLSHAIYMVYFRYFGTWINGIVSWAKKWGGGKSSTDPDSPRYMELYMYGIIHNSLCIFRTTISKPHQSRNDAAFDLNMWYLFHASDAV